MTLSLYMHILKLLSHQIQLAFLGAQNNINHPGFSLMPPISFSKLPRNGVIRTARAQAQKKVPVIIDVDEEEDAWDALDQLEGRVGMKSNKTRGKEKKTSKKPWVPDDMEPILEELPKWTLLAEVLKEIEEEMMRQEAVGGGKPTCTSLRLLLLVRIVR